jgi:hypothetical protein
MEEPIENLYFNWLCAKVINVEVPTPSLTYWRLFQMLHNTEFVWLVAGDDNRAEDGVELRYEFLMEARLSAEPDWSHLGCSLFEMLIAFARRAEFNAGESTHFWFWKFLENLELSEVNDACDWSDEKIERILHKVIWRTYDGDGRGGLFPMVNPPKNQRDVEVWYQFCEYLVDQDWPL